MFVLGYFIWQALCSISFSERNSFGTLDGLKSKMVMWAFSFPFQHHDNVCQSWAPEDVGAPRVCRMRKKDPRQVNLIGNSTIPLAACMLTLFIFQKAKAYLLWTKKTSFWAKTYFRTFAFLTYMNRMLLFLFQIPPKSSGHVLAWGLLEMWLLWL